MSNKNAYEIRLEILKEANQNLNTQYHNRLEAARQDAVSANDGNPEKASGDYLRSVEAPTPEAIIDYAERLYKFVSRD